MTSTQTGRRRTWATLVGALGGLVGGFGATVVVTQSGRVDVDLGAPLLLGSVIVGAIVGFVEPPAWIDRALVVAAVAAIVVVGVVGFGDPAAAQAACSVTVTVDGTTHDLGLTSRDAPVLVDVGSEPTIEFEARVPEVRRGVVEVVVAGTEPIEPFRPTGDQVVYYDEIEGGEARGALDVERAGWTGFRIAGPGYRAPLVPLGLVEVAITVTDLERGATVVSCPETSWVQAVATPAGNPLGQAGLALTALGAGAIVASGPIRRLRSASAPVGPSHAPVPTSGPAADHTEVRILDATGRQVDPAAGLVAGEEYAISITFGLGLDDRDDEAGAELSVAATSRTVSVGPGIAVGVPGTPVSLPLIPRGLGRHRVSIDALRHGHHVQTQRVEFSVVPVAGAPAEPQVTSTPISTVVPSRRALDDLPARQVSVILERDSDTTVDVRIRDVHGATVVSYDSPLRADALDEAAAAVRSTLRDLLAASRSRTTLDRDELAAAGTPLVAAGRRLMMALFPDARVRSGDVDALSRLIVDGATVQVVSDGAALGYATLPWGLLHDHGLVERIAGNPVCESFETHPPGDCPHRDDPNTWCPSGFWGVRAVVEELWASPVAGELRPQVPAVGALTGTDDEQSSVVVAYLDEGLSATPVHARTVARMRATQLRDFDAVTSWLADDDDDLDLVVIYAHHHDGPAGGVRIGDEILSASTMNTLRAHTLDRWPRRPLVIINGCASGAYESTDPVSLLEELRAYGAGGAVTAECAVWDPLAGECGLRILDGLVAGRSIGEVLTALRRDMLREHRNPVGLAYRLLARSDTAVRATEEP